MAFSSMEFLLYFLPIFFLFFWLTPVAYRNITLLAGSLIFYAQGSREYFAVLLVSILINFLISQKLEPVKKKRKKRRKKKAEDSQEENKKFIIKDITRRDILFWLAVAADAGVLCWFKLAGQGMPQGMSFYTFQVISYLADVYRGEVAKEQSPFRFLLYLTMFSKMGSGPITLYGDVKEELKETEVTAEKLQEGMKLFVLGLAAKVLLADRLGILWNDLQVKGYESITTGLAWIGAYAYSLKLYFDFYGYSFMAVGLGKMTGFQLPDNFQTPYMSRSVKEFYRRWHITLGRWFWKYVYVPLGGSRKGEWRTIFNLLVVWLLTGFWHGASLNFLIWGLFLCACIILERQVARFIPEGKGKVLPHLWLWIVIPVSWMCFAITDLSQLQIYLGRMTGLVAAVNENGRDWLMALQDYWGWLLAGILCSSGMAEWIFQKWKNRFWMNLLLTAVFWFCVWRVLIEGNNPFMYLNF